MDGRLLRRACRQAANLRGEFTNEDASMPNGTNRTDHTAANQQLPRPLWSTDIFRGVADYFKHLRDAEADAASRTPSSANLYPTDYGSASGARTPAGYSTPTGSSTRYAGEAEPVGAHQSTEPEQPHQCPRHGERTCNCTANTCADDDCGTPEDCLGCKPFGCARHDPTSHHYQDRCTGPEACAVGHCAQTADNR